MPQEPVRKTKSFKRIRGLLSGRKGSKKSSTPTKSGGGGEEASTIYNVAVEDRSVATSASAAVQGEKKPYMLKVVLLLMDPETRRFELLQLEFDSLKALVSDVLAQIPLSVTEEPLRKQTYTGICGRDGKEMSPDRLLASFCKGNDVLVAIPTSMPARECARLARPILGDEKVISMVRFCFQARGQNTDSTLIVISPVCPANNLCLVFPRIFQLLASGVDAKAWRKKDKKRKSASEDVDSASSSVTSKTFTVLFIVLAGILLQVFHLYISAPIKPGHVVSPGIWLTKCGIMSFLPSCDNSYVSFDDKGVVKLIDSNDEVLWEIVGSICDDGDEDCVPGMQVKEDSTLVVGGKQISTVKMYGDADLSPWPFAEQPKVRIVKTKK